MRKSAPEHPRHVRKTTLTRTELHQLAGFGSGGKREHPPVLTLETGFSLRCGGVRLGADVCTSPCGSKAYRRYMVFVNGGGVVGLGDVARYQAWREKRSAELIGPYATKTAGAYMNTPQRRTAEGWIYAGRDAFCFFADDPIELAYMSAPGQVDQRTLVIAYQDCEIPEIRTAPGSPNMILDFGGGREFVGARDRMEQFHRLFSMWQGGTGSAEHWDAAADVSGLPLYQGASRVPSRPPQTLLGFLLGVGAAIFTLWGAISGDPAGTFATVTWPSDALFVVAFSLILATIGRWLPNLILGFSLAAIPTSVVSAVILFAKGFAAGGWMFLFITVCLFLARFMSRFLSVRRIRKRYAFYG